LRTINPDEAIARGAAIQAALKARDSALEEIVLTDVMPFSLGVIATEEIDGRIYRDRFSPIIERNNPVPISRVQSFRTMKPGQTRVELDIRQGESPVGSDNLKLGTLSVDLPWDARSGVTVDVRFSYDVNGLLEVEALVPSSHLTFRTVIQRSSEEMTPEEIAISLESLKALKIHPRDKQENIYFIKRAKRLYASFLGAEREQVGRALLQFESALDTQDERLIRQHTRRFKEFLDSIDHGFVI
jgi:molecular chaperone HscC